MTDLTFLSAAEQNYKKLYLETGAYSDSTPLTAEEFHRILNGLPGNLRELQLPDLADFLDETDFFEKDLDIAVLSSCRYMPPVYHQHDFFELACVIRGRFRNFIGDRNFFLEAGDILILAPNTRHAVCSLEDDSFMINILVRTAFFENNFMQVLPDSDLLRHFFIRTFYNSEKTPYLLFRVGQDERVLSYSTFLLEEYRQNHRYKITMLRSLLSTMLVSLLRYHEQDVIVPSGHSSMLTENTLFILQYMQQNYASITLSHLAQFFNYSERQIQRIISAATGKSFNENIFALRMAHAEEYLLSTQLPVRTIAEQLGYFDASSFRRNFRRYYGMTPQEFRQKRSDKTD